MRSVYLKSIWYCLALIFGCIVASGPSVLIAETAQLQPGPVGSPHGKWNEQLWWVPVRPDPHGNQVFLLETLVYRPSGPGKFPLVTINHGLPFGGTLDADLLHKGSPYDLKRAALWFAEHGYAVAVPNRRGVGRSQGQFADSPDHEWSHKDLILEGKATASDIANVVVYMQRQPFVDQTKVVVLGNSAGGWGSLALATDPPTGVVGVINFSGGRTRPADRIALINAAQELGKRNRLPQLWLYSASDRLYDLSLASAMYKAFSSQSKQKVEFIQLPSFQSDGHVIFQKGNPNLWAAPVQQFLQSLPTD